eukprot:SAG22_NODE_1685_length_3810_cov_28.206413_2_plen_70_part_00
MRTMSMAAICAHLKNIIVHVVDSSAAPAFGTAQLDGLDRKKSKIPRCKRGRHQCRECTAEKHVLSTRIQ